MEAEDNWWLSPGFWFEGHAEVSPVQNESGKKKIPHPNPLTEVAQVTVWIVDPLFIQEAQSAKHCSVCFSPHS